MRRLPVALPDRLIAPLLGMLLALTLPPLPTGLLTPFVLALVLWHVAAGATPREVARRLFWVMTVAIGIHLSWLMVFLGDLFRFAPLGVLALALYALEGAFYGALAFVVARLLPGPHQQLGRVWALAGGWLGLEALRFLGPLGFPWPTLGYSLIGTPMIQVADLGGVLLCSALVTCTAAALVTFWQGRSVPLWLTAAVWVLALGYGVTRVPATGPVSRALVVRSNIDAFAKAGNALSAEQQFQVYNRLTLTELRPGEVPIWPETAIQTPLLLTSAPSGGLYGLGEYGAEHRNEAVVWTGTQVTARTDKARPVPFGEYFPLRGALAPAWELIERSIGVRLESLPPATDLHPLPLGGVNYGAYVCYDSVFPWVARQLSREGANVLVNISNDGWYAGWGVQQHFLMGRVRAIENRRWVLRSVNEGIAASIDDLGRPRQTLRQGEGALHVAFPVLTTRTVFQQVGDWPALLLAALMVGYGWLIGRRPS